MPWVIGAGAGQPPDAAHCCCGAWTCALLPAGLDFVFHIFFLVKYSKALEEGTFRGRSADFLWMLLLGALQCMHGTLVVLCSPGLAHHQACLCCWVGDRMSMKSFI